MYIIFIDGKVNEKKLFFCKKHLYIASWKGIDAPSHLGENFYFLSWEEKRETLSSQAQDAGMS